MENLASSMRDRKVIIAAHMYVLESFKREICEKQCIKNNAIVLNRLVQFNVIRRYVKTNSSPYYS